MTTNQKGSDITMLKPRYLLGIDIGTSACKVAAFSRDGQVIASHSTEYPIYYPRPGWAEQDPDEWWDAVCFAVRELLCQSDISAEDIAGIGIDGQSWSAIAVDASGTVLTNTPIWMDTRARDICEDLNQKIGTERIFDLCGNPLQPSYTTAKILWYQQALPEVYKNIYKILSSNGFIAYRLTGNITLDISQAYGFHCFDMRQGCWDTDIT